MLSGGNRDGEDRFGGIGMLGRSPKPVAGRSGEPVGFPARRRGRFRRDKVVFEVGYLMGFDLEEKENNLCMASKRARYENRSKLWDLRTKASSNWNGKMGPLP